MELQATDDDYQYDMQSLQAADEDYQFDELYDIPDQQTIYDGVSNILEKDQGQCLRYDSLPGQFEEIWDSSWDLEAKSLSQLVCSPGREVLSIHIPNLDVSQLVCSPGREVLSIHIPNFDEELFELIVIKDLESDINYDDELELGEQISSCEELLRGHT